ncbi:nucleotidyltransferase family protein [Bacillus sp. 3255]|uniref:nucleotidyltransferase domain-containing protein n=1 Tax=Bacillus sp. 3255 TaxID=2817904 RepID=UPI0028623F4E|nr:nucleotidyltransferase family protein [Bacillus sp. 3255]MDR6878663.1 hypothetical protein [Bacillus sp. 3255]
MGTEWNLNVVELPKELKLLLLFMKRESEGSQLPYSEDLFVGMDWKLFLELTRHHRVYPYVFNQVKLAGSGSIPSFVTQQLRQDYQQNTFHMLRLSGEMEHFCSLLTEHKINVLLLKGPALATNLYGDLSKRTCSDLDVLISIDDLDKTHDLLIQLGYVKEDYFSTVMNDWRWRHHHVTYFHSLHKIKLEIHWRLSPGPSYEPSFHELWNRKRLSPLTSSPVYTLGYEDLFMFLVSHGARHGWSRLRWLLDMDRIVRGNGDWQSLNGLLKKYEMRHVGGQALVLASEMLGAPVPKALIPLTTGKRPRRLAQDTVFYFRQMIHLHKEPLPDDVAKYHKRHLFSLMSFRLKLLHVLSFLYPYPMDVELLPLPRNLHFLYFPLRPFLWAWRKTRKQALQ